MASAIFALLSAGALASGSTGLRASGPVQQLLSAIDSSLVKKIHLCIHRGTNASVRDGTVRSMRLCALTKGKGRCLDLLALVGEHRRAPHPHIGRPLCGAGLLLCMARAVPIDRLQIDSGRSLIF